jgi:hypothetical protein
MKEEETSPYTVEELLKRAEEGRRQIALGNYTEVEDFLRELDKNFEEEAMNKSSFTAAEELHYEAI